MLKKDKQKIFVPAGSESNKGNEDHPQIHGVIVQSKSHFRLHSQPRVLIEHDDEKGRKRRMDELISYFSLNDQDRDSTLSLKLRPNLRTNGSKILSKSFEIEGSNSISEDSNNDLYDQKLPNKSSFGTFSSNLEQKINDYGAQKLKYQKTRRNEFKSNLTTEWKENYISAIDAKLRQLNRNIKMPLSYK